MNMSEYSGAVEIQGGKLQVLSQNSTLNNLNWSSGGFIVDFSAHTPIALAGSVNVSTMPQADDAFIFENISPGEYTLFTYPAGTSPFRAFAGQSADYSCGGKTYSGRFAVGDDSLKIIFAEK